MTTAKQYIARNDFEGCLERFNQATKNWKNHWFETLQTIYQQSTEWAKTYILDPVAQTVEKIRKAISTILGDSIVFEGCEPLDDGTEQFYILELLDDNGQLIWSKVGTTTRHTLKRMKEHLRYYKNQVSTIKVLRVWDCEKYPAECYESFFRAYYIRKYPQAFNKNDRFTKIKFDLEEADKLFQDWKNNKIQKKLKNGS